MAIRTIGHTLFAILAAGTIGFVHPGAFAIQASPWPIDEVQPDGTRIKIYLRGDEHRHWEEDEQGYTILRDGGWFRYAEPGAAGELRASKYTVGKDAPAATGLTRGLRPATSVALLPGIGVSAPVERSAPDARIAPMGVVKNIVILMRFSDQLARPLPAPADFDVLLNSVGGHPALAPTGSVKDFYYENSYGQFTLDSTVFGWVDLPRTESYYANNASGLTSRTHEALISALQTADSLIDFSQFDQDHDGFVDSIAFIHSGYGAEWGGADAFGADYTQRIWSHRSSIPAWTSKEGIKVSAYHINPALWSTSGNSITHLAVICHETGHFFGLPDLYDTDQTGEGAGSWEEMANSWGFDFSQYHPPHFSSWSKIRLGWVTPTILSFPGTYTLPNWEFNPVVYKIVQGFPANEYLLVENRQPLGFETDIPGGGGIVVFHIDENTGFYTEGYPQQEGWPANGNHYRVSVLQADGQYDLERGIDRGDGGDAYRGGSVSALTPATLPGTNTYQDGRIRYTGNAITNISMSGPTMSFLYDTGDPLRLDTQGKTWWTFNSAGAPGGPFSPNSQSYTLINTSFGASVSVGLTTREPWLSMSVPTTVITPFNGTNVSVNVSPNAAYLPQGTYNARANIRNTDTGFSYDIDAHLLVSSLIADFPLDTDPGWTHDGLWAFGEPLGSAGDPSSGHTGANVFGFNLEGLYSNNIPARQLTTTPVNCSAYDTVLLRFWRWLGVEAAPFDGARVQASNDGVNFTDVWVHNGAAIDDGQWVEQWIDLTAVAAGKSNVQVRWIMGPTDAAVQYYGWNIDDVSFHGLTNNQQLIRMFNMNADPGFTKVGNWNWGISSGNSGDPNSGHTGAFIYGFNLQGPYPNDLPERPATTPPVNCTGYGNVHLKFWRVLTIEESTYDHAKVQVSNDGIHFVDVWVHDGPTLLDTQWVLQDLDISAIADNQPTVYARWIMGMTDESVTYGGWNLDDVSFVGTPTDPSGVIWVDFGNFGTQNGTQTHPYTSLTAGATMADEGGTVRIKGISFNTNSAETMQLSKPLRIEATGGTVHIGRN